MKKTHSLISAFVSVALAFAVAGCHIDSDIHEHSFSKDWTSNATDHWHAATCEHAKEVSDKAVHIFGEWKTTVEATEETEGKQERSCSVCLYKEEQSLAKLDHTHKFSSDWTSNATDHWHAATCEHTKEVSDKAAHTFGEWTVTKAATCTEKGSRKHTCSVCKYEATEDISAKGHAYSEDWTNDATDHWHAATCEHAEDVSDKTAHTFGEWTVTKAATCTEKGSRKHTCSVCKYEATEDISAKGHAYSEDWTSDATDHWHAATCEHAEEVSEKAEHSFGDWTTIPEFVVILDSYDAAKEMEVIKAVHAAVPGIALKDAMGIVKGAPKIIKRNVSKADADAMIAKITEAGGSVSKKEEEVSEKEIKERSCSVCSYKETAVHLHKFAEAWTCDASGHWHDAICGHEVTEGYGVHDFLYWKVTKEATCTENGEKKATCTTCKYEATEDISAKGHAYSEDWTNDATDHWHAATCGHDVTDSKAEHSFVNDVCTICEYSRFVLIPAGTFQMGSNAGEDRNKPVHEVTITKSFYMGKYEVTQAEYKKYCGSSSPSSSYGDGDNYPANYVSWYDAIVYCNKRSMAEGLTPCYSISGNTDPSKWGTVPTSSNNTWNAVVCNWNANGYRLPTEAEWEYAARAGDNTVDSLTYSGTSDVNKLGEYAWYYYNSNNKKHEVGTKLSNDFGLYDMTGNVWEWCWNWYRPSYDAKTEGGSDPTGASAGSNRVLRGGSWRRSSDRCAVSSRDYDMPYDRDNSLGFRVVHPSSN